MRDGAEITITEEPPDSDDGRALIAELDAVVTQGYPAEAIHGFSVDRLLEEGVRFFVTRVDGVAACCGGILFVGSEYAELKRMFVRPEQRGRGLARRMLAHLAAEANARGVDVLRLETGMHQVEAMALYESEGFQRRGPFGDYPDLPESRFYEKRL